MKSIIIGILAIAIQVSAYAESSKRESVEELLRITNVDSMIDNMYSQMDQMFVGMGQQMGIKTSEQDIFDNYMKKVTASMKEMMSWEKMKAPMTDIYLTSYTEKEIQDMLDFYRSETGRSLIKKMPQVMSESMMLSQEMMKGFMPKVQELSVELNEELKARRTAQ
jgi:uncharacterized protein